MTERISHPRKLAARAAWHRRFGSTATAEALEADLAAAGRCRRCGRTLTDPESVAAGLGRDCRRKEQT
jgi:hypothetical protein